MTRNVAKLKVARQSKHSFRNDPDKLHQTCVTCGCKRVDTYHNATGSHTITYFDKYGNKLNGLPEKCESIYDLLNS